MANLLRVEPTKSHLTGEPDGHAWFVFDDGRSYHRKLDAQEEPAARSAMIISDTIEPLMSHADGKMHTSKASLYASYKSSGNPQGERYECIGERVAEPYKRPARTRDDRAKAMQAVTRTLEEMGL